MPVTIPLPADYKFHPHGTVWLIEPTNDQAAMHLRYQTDRKKARWFGIALAVESCLATRLADQLRAHGFTVTIAGRIRQ